MDYIDAAGNPRNYGEEFVDSSGHTRRANESYVDAAGFTRRPGEKFIDYDGYERSPGEGFVDADGIWREPKQSLNYLDMQQSFDTSSSNSSEYTPSYGYRSEAERKAAERLLNRFFELWFLFCFWCVFCAFTVLIWPICFLVIKIIRIKRGKRASKRLKFLSGLFTALCIGWVCCGAYWALFDKAMLNKVLAIYSSIWEFCKNLTIHAIDRTPSFFKELQTDILSDLYYRYSSMNKFELIPIGFLTLVILFIVSLIIYHYIKKFVLKIWKNMESVQQKVEIRREKRKK